MDLLIPNASTPLMLKIEMKHSMKFAKKNRYLVVRQSLEIIF